MARSPPGGTRPDTPHHHVALWLRATVEMRLRRVYAQGGVWRMCGRGRAGVRQERTAQYGGRMFVFATTQGVQGDMPSENKAAGERVHLNFDQNSDQNKVFQKEMRGSK